MLLAELQQASGTLESASPLEILKWAVEQYAPNFAMATAFGPEGMTLIHMLAELAPQTPIFNLETGYQFPETLELRERVKDRYGIEVQFIRPLLDVAQYEEKHGGPLYSRDPNQCCFDRKIKLLEQVAAGLHAWSSAIRRDQSPDRARTPIVGWDQKFQLVKVSPLANSTRETIWEMTGTRIPDMVLRARARTVGDWSERDFWMVFMERRARSGSDSACARR